MNVIRALRVSQAHSRPLFHRMPVEFSTLTHVDPAGGTSMVDVGDKRRTDRVAIAGADVILGAEAYKLLSTEKNSKGAVFSTAETAGLLGAKATSSLIPHCHPVSISRARVDLSLQPDKHAVHIRTQVRAAHAATGVEMEALTAASVAALTVYDMCKAADKGIVISQVRLLHKSGGSSGDYFAEVG